MKKVFILFMALAIVTACKKKEIEPTPVPVPVPGPVNDLPDNFKSLKEIFNGEGIGAAVNLTEDVVVFFNTAGNKYAWFEDDLIKATYNLSDPNGPLSDCPFDEISAATVMGASDDQIWIFDGTGNNYTKGNFTVADVDDGFSNSNLFTFTGVVHPLNIWGLNDDCPFNSISAMWRFSNAGTSCFDASVYSNIIWMVNGPGDEIVIYNNGSGNFHTAEEVENFTFENNCGGPDGLLPFPNIGASCRIHYPNKIMEVFFSADGKQFTFCHVSEGVFSPIYNLNY